MRCGSLRTALIQSIAAELNEIADRLEFDHALFDEYGRQVRVRAEQALLDPSSAEFVSYLMQMTLLAHYALTVIGREKAALVCEPLDIALRSVDRVGVAAQRRGDWESSQPKR
jgi:hypothetical protein